MIKHISKKYLCAMSHLVPYSRFDANQLSMSKKFLFYFDTDTLTLNDYIYITSNYHATCNYIYENFRNKPVAEETQSNDVALPFGESSPHNTTLHVSLKPESQEISSMNVTSESGSESDIEALVEKDHFVKEKESPEYICMRCNTKFSIKRSWVRHIEDTPKKRQHCERKKVQNDHMQMQIMKQQLTEKPSIQAPAPQISIQGQNNSVNIQNIQNIHNNNITKVDIRDFLESNSYDHSHIVAYDLDHDFYVLNKFLPLLMENDHNHNMFFDTENRCAYVSTSNTKIRKLPSDKTGFMVIEKLKKTISNLICDTVSNADDRSRFEYMVRYYTKLSSKFRWDTVHRVYNHETQSFQPSGSAHLLRTRDVLLAEIVEAVNLHEDEIRQKLNVNTSSPQQQYIDINPCIEDFASTRVRYRDLKK
jgi:hypothetical protein